MRDRMCPVACIIRHAPPAGELALGAERFFELCRGRARSVLNLKGSKKWWQGGASRAPAQAMTRALMRTQHDEARAPSWRPLLLGRLWERRVMSSDEA
jgi:hypothetical protein